MYLLKKYHGERFSQINKAIEELSDHINGRINLIGSSTLPFKEVCDIQSLPATSCRVEGHLDSRLFPDTQSIDTAEQVIFEKLHELLDLNNKYGISSHPHSATQANQIIYHSLLSEGDKVLSLSILDGGHISHRYSLPKGVSVIDFPIDNGKINYKMIRSLIAREKPRLITAGSTSYPLEINFKKLKDACGDFDTLIHADLAHTAPFVMAGIHESVSNYADFITLDTSKNLRGPKGGVIIFDNNHKKNIERAIFPKIQSSPNQTAILAKAMCFSLWDKKSIYSYASKLIKNAKLLSRELNELGFNTIWDSPDAHIILIDLSNFKMTGVDFEVACSEAGILVNRNQVPGDKSPHWVASGARIGVSTITILDFDKEDVFFLAQALHSIASNNNKHKEIVFNLINKYYTGISRLSIANV
ncbi:beta-eliminating lyase-related protein [Pseudoalteromonas luteoviolacea]|uniref:Serine hydroxymethyltransferase-like domain-containing protein n=1 Tax=Pseudoalteromonas luteoviolacea S4060-1 TaxID=1365257 RepID=A0A167JG05_9GAMM|nr:beta-eliminating lyase-related protein [Pseudoalteromonas luteoviolacea]KZN61039.1 hypothetical protein N478_25850 [Pseudoalteromonas luteoviolacea S4060-1]